MRNPVEAVSWCCPKSSRDGVSIEQEVNLIRHFRLITGLRQKQSLEAMHRIHSDATGSTLIGRKK